MTRGPHPGRPASATGTAANRQCFAQNTWRPVKPPKIDWRVVDCAFVEAVSGSYDEFKGKKGKWVMSDKASQKFSSRQLALANIVERYEK